MVLFLNHTSILGTVHYISFHIIIAKSFMAWGWNLVSGKSCAMKLKWGGVGKSHLLVNQCLSSVHNFSSHPHLRTAVYFLPLTHFNGQFLVITCCNGDSALGLFLTTIFSLQLIFSFGLLLWNVKSSCWSQQNTSWIRIRGRPDRICNSCDALLSAQGLSPLHFYANIFIPLFVDLHCSLPGKVRLTPVTLRFALPAVLPWRAIWCIVQHGFPAACHRPLFARRMVATGPSGLSPWALLCNKNCQKLQHSHFSFRP